MFFDLTRYGGERLAGEIKSLMALAVPMSIAQLAQLGMGLVDTVMAGHAGKQDLAAVGLGVSVFTMIFLTMTGIPTIYNPILSNHFGAGRIKELGRSLGEGVWLSLILGLATMGLVMLSAACVPFFFHLDPYTLKTTSLFLFAVSFGMPAGIVYRVLHAYGSSLNRPNPIMWVSLLSLALVIPVNYALIYGKFGLPRMGGAGCGVGTSLGMWFNVVALTLYFRFSGHFSKYRTPGRFRWPGWRAFGPALRMGVPIGMSFFLEASLFSFIAILAAPLGVDVVAANQIVYSVATLIYVVPMTVGAAVSVRVGQSLGERRPALARYIAGISLASAFAGCLLNAVLVAAFRIPISGLFTSSPEVLAICSTLMLYCAAYQLVDAFQTVATGALRGYKKTAIPMVIHGVSFWGVGVFGGHWLCYGAGLGISGFWLAVTLALGFAAVFLTVYLSQVSLGHVRMPWSVTTADD